VTVVDGFATLEHGEGCPTATNEEATRRLDRDYFERHPGTVRYTRRLMPGDLGVSSLDCIMATADELPPTVTVTRVADGVRAVSIDRAGQPWVVNVLSLDGQRVALLMGPGGGR